MPFVKTDYEAMKDKERITFLYQSEYLQDNLTAILMDVSYGGFGLNEDIAVAKAHRIIGWMDFIKRPKNV